MQQLLPALLLLILTHLPVAIKDLVAFDVKDYGAAGDGITDDTQAFADAWEATCGNAAGLPIMFIPGEKFLVSPIIFKGPCKPSNVLVQVEGTLAAPDSPSTWNRTDASLWIQFKSVDGLRLTGSGSGRFDGRGSNWWRQSCKLDPRKAVKFVQCNDLAVSNLRFINSPQTHILIIDSSRVYVTNLNITAPRTSPNTDGIHIHASRHVYIQDTIIGTGDDCISIGDRTSDIVVTRITCGPGHGISVGSLGRGGSNVSVERIQVSYVNFFNTTNGARIKTWQGATGYAKSMSFERIRFNNVQNPIIIDQNYGAKANNYTIQQNAVHISNVRYAYCAGTARTHIAINLNCSQTVPCTDIQFDNVNIRVTSRGDTPRAYCNNAHVTTSGYINPP
ncbi:Glycosyl hydrolases family 28, partial [Musa troglodytarum]